MDAPTTGSYLLVQPDDTLTNSRLLVSSSEIRVVDTGPGNNLILKTARLLGSLADVERSGFYGIQGIDLAPWSLISDSSLEIINPRGADGDPILKAVDDTTIQKINVSVNGTPITPARPGINLIGSDTLVVSVTPDEYDNKLDINISAPTPSGGDGGTVTSVNLSSSTGLVITGANPLVDGEGIINIDLPSGGSADQVLTYTTQSPYTIGWTTPTTSGDVTSFGLTSLDHSVGISTGENPLKTGNGTFTLSLKSWSTGDPNTDINCNGNEVQDLYHLTLSDEGGAIPPSSPSIYQQLSGYLGVNMTWNSTNVALIPILCSLTQAGPPAQSPVDTSGYACAGTLLFGNGSGDLPLYQQLLPPSNPGYYKLKINTSSNGPYWAQTSLASSHIVTLGNTIVPATDTEDPIDLGDGTHFIGDPNITSSSVVLASSTSHYYDSDAPAIGPLGVRLNPTTGSGQLPVGYIISGDPTYDNGKKVTVSVVVY